MHSINSSMLLLLLLLFFPSMIISFGTYKTACELLKLPRDCHCQRTRGVPNESLNETRLRCRQLTEITTNHRWSIVPYDRLAFETPNDNLTLYPFAFADIRARTLRFDVQNLFLQDHALDNAYIGQLAIMHSNDYGTVNFEVNGQVFYGTTITNVFFKTIDFQHQISEIIFSNARIYSVLIQSSKFYGFTNRIMTMEEKNVTTTTKHDTFLEYDFISTSSSSSSSLNSSPSSPPLKVYRQKKLKEKKIRRQLYETSDESSSQLPERTIRINITAINLPAFINIYTVLASIATHELTEYYFPSNIDYSQTDEIELSFNKITSIGANAFRHLQFFEGRLILRYNQIQSIDPFAFVDLYSLNNLSLANNFLQDLTETHFQNLTQLIELDLSSNRIEKLNGTLFQALSHLQVLRLNQNPLTYIDPHALTPLTYLKELHLQGVKVFHHVDRDDSLAWVWSLARTHGRSLLRTNFDLSDVAFCLLSRFNQTSYYSLRQHTCSCNIHYVSSPSDLNSKDNAAVPMKYLSNYLRLSAICSSNQSQSSSPSEQKSPDGSFVFRGLDDQCDYQFLFLDCDAMTTTTTEATTVPETTTTTTESTTESTIPTTNPRYYIHTITPGTTTNNTKKLFIVLAILVAITIAAIILVILWYRLKAIFKRQQKRKKLLEQQRRLNLPSTTTNNNNNANLSASLQRLGTPRYASSDRLSSMPSTQFPTNKSQSQLLIAPNMVSATVFKNIDALTNDSIQSYPVDDDNSIQTANLNDQRTTEIQATTPC